MPAEDHFINRGLLKVKVNDYLRQELRRAGYAGVDLQKTPLGMRVVVYAARPGMVIGRRGTTVRDLTENLEHEFGLEAPQIEVSEVEVPELNGPIMAERLAQRLERGDHFRRAAYGVLRRIIGAGAKGVEISIAGKLTSRRARYQKFRSGFVAKTGEPIRHSVSHGWAYAVMKPGVLGVQVRIMLPDIVAPDRPVIVHREVEVQAPPTPIPKAAEIEIIEEELPIEEAPSIEEFVEEELEPAPESDEPEAPVAPHAEPTAQEGPPSEKKPVPEEPKVKPTEKPKAAPTKPKEPAKPTAPPKAKPVEKEAKPEPTPKVKKAKAEKKPSTKPKAEPKAKPKTESKEKAKAEKKPSTKPKAEAKPKTAKDAKATEKEKKTKSKETKDKTAKSKKESSKK
jgi:small subunit ribosomal protein S3